MSVKNKLLLSFLSVILGIFFIVSGLGKVVNVAGFVNVLESYGMGYAAYLAPVICVAEITLGLFMLFLVNPKKYALICFFALLIFTLSFAYAYFFRNVNDCGCFGEIGFLKSSAISSFTRNLLLITFSFIVYKNSGTRTNSVITWKRNIIIFFSSLFLILSGYTMNTPILSSVPFDNEKIENTPLAKYLKTSVDSTYLIFVFSYKCPHCWDATENIKSYKEQKIVDRIIGIAVGDSVAASTYGKTFNIDFKTITVSKDSMQPLAKAFPTVYIIKNNKIEYVMQQHIYNAYTFYKFYPDMKQ